MKHKELVLIRHAESVANDKDGDHWPDGPATIPLSLRGIESAKSLAAQWNSTFPDLLCCSTYTRSIQTATPLAERFGLPLLKLPFVREFTFWDFKWMAAEYLAKRTEAAGYWLRLDPAEKAGGENAESFIDCLERVHAFREWAVQTEFNTCLCVTHGYFMQIFRAVIGESSLSPRELMLHLRDAHKERPYANLQRESFLFPM